ncbi:hypothetical protein [Martelella mediterranea]|uniref:hypothetical protein n=1 Tax=uncultured Martelella sp. TaxID=392331 RepID=UPI000D410ED0|nr:hypothetical protein [uncultured Martelella sp.]
MADEVRNKERKASPENYKPRPEKVAGTDDSKYAAEMAYRHGRPCESSAVFETWAQH